MKNSTKAIIGGFVVGIIGAALAAYLLRDSREGEEEVEKEEEEEISQD